MESLRYLFSNLIISNGEPITFMVGDVFKFNIRVSSYSFNSDFSIRHTRLLHYSHSHLMPCHSFVHESPPLLRILLSRIPFLVDSLEEIIEKTLSSARQMFQVNVPSAPSLESPHREIPLLLQISMIDNSMNVVEEDAMQRIRMIPASNEVIQRSLQRSEVVTQIEDCPICFEEMNVNNECYKMPCNHAFHEPCIVSWLKINNVCPMCRYILPTS